MEKLAAITTSFWHLTRIPALYWKVFLAIILLSAYLLFPQVTLSQEFKEEAKKQEALVIKTLPEFGLREPSRTKKIVVTAYSSTPDQTDSTPFITANGRHVADGIIATNSLPFGTRVRFPEIDPSKTYIVHDRMARRFSRRADIWMPTREEAVQFGVKYTTIEIW